MTYSEARELAVDNYNRMKIRDFKINSILTMSDRAIFFLCIRTGDMNLVDTFFHDHANQWYELLAGKMHVASNKLCYYDSALHVCSAYIPYSIGGMFDKLVSYWNTSVDISHMFETDDFDQYPYYARYRRYHTDYEDDECDKNRDYNEFHEGMILCSSIYNHISV